MNELRAHPVRLLTIAVAGLMAFTTTYAVGSYGDDPSPYVRTHARQHLRVDSVARPRAPRGG